MISEILGAAQLLAYRPDDDYIDRLHYFLTSNILIALSLLVSFKQFGGKPIECMTPKMYPDSWEDYAENFCWAQDTYFLPMSKKVMSTNKAVRYKSMISYYQWVPFFLLFSAACFRLPSIFWKYLAGHSGIQIHDIVGLASDRRNLEPEARKTNLRSLTIHLQNALRFHRRLMKKNVQPHRYLLPLNLPYTAFFVTFIYIFVKILYFANVVIQLFFMNYFLGTASATDENDQPYEFYGFGALADILIGKPWDTSGVFPRISYCDFDIRMMGSNVQRYSVQCVLVINIFNEKIFVFLWFWYLCLLFLTFLSMVYWMIIMAVPAFSRWFVSRHLELSELPFDPHQSRKDVDRFVHGYLKTDGLFILRMITMHAGIIFGTDLTLSLWRTFYNIEADIKRQLSNQLTPTPTNEKKDTHLHNKLNVLRLRKSLTDKTTEKSGGGKKSSTKSSKSSKPSSLKKPKSAPANTPTAPPDKDDSDENNINSDHSESNRLLEILVPDDRRGIAAGAASILPTLMLPSMPPTMHSNAKSNVSDDDDDTAVAGDRDGGSDNNSNSNSNSDDNEDDDDDDDNDDDDDRQNHLTLPQLTSLAMLAPQDENSSARGFGRRPRSRSPMPLSPLTSLSPLTDIAPPLSAGLLGYSHLTPSQMSATTLVYGQQQLAPNTSRTVAHRIGRHTPGIVGLPRSSSNSREARQVRDRTDTGRRAGGRAGRADRNKTGGSGV